MNKIMKVLLSCVMAAALALMGILGGGLLRDRRALRDLNADLQESRKTWEDIAERKEALQEELKTVTENLKEAKLTLEESNTRAEELRADIAGLEREIEQMKQQKETGP